MRLPIEGHDILYPDIGGGLLAPEIQQVVLRVEPHYRLVAAVRRDRVVRGAIDPQRWDVGRGITRLEPFLLE
jgi:hypothetical protein